MSEGLTRSLGITVKTLRKNDDGSVDVNVELTEQFKEWFMYMHGLNNWNEDYFQQWFLKSLGDYIGE
jgi:hypothetical protein